MEMMLRSVQVRKCLTICKRMHWYIIRTIIVSPMITVSFILNFVIYMIKLTLYIERNLKQEEQEELYWYHWWYRNGSIHKSYIDNA